MNDGLARVAELELEVARLRAALIDIGRHTKWVGWLERGRAAISAGPDMRAIKDIAEKATGKSFDELT